MTKNNTLLLVDDDISFVQVMARALTRRGFEVLTANHPKEALALAQNHNIHRAIVDLKMEGQSGLQLIPQLKASQPEMNIIMLTAYSSIATAVEAVKRGANNYLCKPTSIDSILLAFGDDDASKPEVSVPNSPHSLDRLEWEHIHKVLQENNNNISATARSLNMHRRTLQRKLQKKPVKQ